jgi:hypothetical protein
LVLTLRLNRQSDSLAVRHSGRDLNPCLKAKVLLRQPRGRGEEGEGEKGFLSFITGVPRPWDAPKKLEGEKGREGEGEKEFL